MTKLFTLCAITLVSIAAATTTLSTSAETNMPIPARAHLQLEKTGPVSLRGGRASSTLDDAERSLSHRHKCHFTPCDAYNKHGGGHYGKPRCAPGKKCTNGNHHQFIMYEKHSEKGKLNPVWRQAHMTSKNCETLAKACPHPLRIRLTVTKVVKKTCNAHSSGAKLEGISITHHKLSNNRHDKKYFDDNNKCFENYHKCFKTHSDWHVGVSNEFHIPKTVSKTHPFKLHAHFTFKKFEPITKATCKH